MTQTPLTSVLFKAAALFATACLVLASIPASGSDLDASSDTAVAASVGEQSEIAIKKATGKSRAQVAVPWGLDRIDQRGGTNSRYSFAESGAGVTVYILDTGIFSKHSEFRDSKTGTSRVLPGYSAIPGGTEDCNGHGTHVAGTIGSNSFGVAKGVSLVPVRILDCNGEGAVRGVIEGLDWVTSQAPVGQKIAILSFVSSPSTALDAAVNKLIDSGTTVVVAAGNNKDNACNYSPSRVPNAITVAASDSNDNLARFSNRGSCVDIIAPGSFIKSSWHTSSVASKTISGTSMASPHVAGAIALLFQRFGSRSPEHMQQIVKSLGSKNVIKKLPAGTANLLLHTDPKSKILGPIDLSLASSTQTEK